ncbi:mannosyl-oligosaccharide glucosidase [Pieris brassicae]|uniref:mannosyl-oligosaccharide glucosidase n=1 Tax=Pieris brassicae TaxID=7116 RepID=UPI001E65E675|nr:mannosyl-oligosaccharide glucosidase [Pieris brassicae]XP_045530625.1 mannosyl-oligosaccharide glucosidase [Pieris brassicae]
MRKMVKHRKPSSLSKHSSNIETSGSSTSESQPRTRSYNYVSVWKTTLGVICLSVAVYIGTLGYLETRVNTPFDGEKAVKESGLDVPDRFWGSYRPGVYFGLKSREPKSPVFGMMWYELATAVHKGIRHWCDQNDNLPSYGWIRHDGFTFGEQIISDPPHNIVTTFVKTPGGEHGGHWTARINITSVNKSNDAYVLIWYGALDESQGFGPQSRIWGEKGAIVGYTPSFGNFRVHLIPHQGKLLHTAFTDAYSPGLHLLKEKYYSLLKVEKHPFGRLAVLGPDNELNAKNKDVNFVPVQMLVETPFVLDIVYTTEDLSGPPLKGEDYTKVLEQKKTSFDARFEEEFKLKDKGYSEVDISIAKAAMSNMVGGIGYFDGTSRVQSQYTREPVPYWKAALYTGVPSRSFFPRGFLWDEGFHGLLVGRWSPDIQMDIAAHWLDLINVEGWIPREQILGAESLARVPKEFVVQSNAAANPPMLLIQIANMVQRRPNLFQHDSKHRRMLERMFPRLQTWYNWFLNSQKGIEPTTYRWRGREDDGIQLNPKTLTSGLDDYPRASHPSEIERHVDLRCWMFAAADAMTVIAFALQRDTSKFEAIREQLGDEKLLNKLHWASHSNSYADYGLHTDGVKLVRQASKFPGEGLKVVRSVTSPPQPRLVASAFGYISLFPMLLKVLSPKSDNLGKILAVLDKPSLLWSPYGLRSLSKSAPLYMKRNTEHDPPYWRGQVWININYLALSALKHYASVEGPHASRAEELHTKLKTNVVGNIITQYKKTGYFWEQYSDQDGRGSGCKPFTGWTALFVLMMADEY